MFDREQGGLLDVQRLEWLVHCVCIGYTSSWFSFLLTFHSHCISMSGLVLSSFVDNVILLERCTFIPNLH